jgi:hypothetical protein
MPRLRHAARHALLAGSAALLLAQPARAQNWISDRIDNSIINVDRIATRYHDQVRQEIERVGRRPAPLPQLNAEERRAAASADRWWRPMMDRTANEGGRPLRVSLAFLYDSAMINSAQLRVFGDVPAIRDTLEIEVAGRYVPRVYGEGSINNGNSPTPNLATTSGAQRLINRERAAEVGLRQRLVTGAEITAGQRFMNFTSNSTNYAPGAQSLSRTFVTIVQPLLRDSGTAYTRSLHEVARLDSRIGQAEFRRQAEAHLLEVARAYWTLYLARAIVLQKERSVAAVRNLAGQVAGRSDLDADLLLASRAQSALALREADLLRARAAVRNAEARVRGLVNDPRFEVAGAGDLMPTDAPLVQHEPITLQTTLERAVALRPEVQALFLQQRAAVLREGQAQIEALPRLDMIVEGNLGGRGLDTGLWGTAFSDAWRYSNNPGALFGMRLEIPIGTDELMARLQRRRLETRQVESQGRATIATIIAEAEITLNEYNVAWREVGARALTMRLSARDLGIETERWNQGVAGRQGELAANALDRLLNAQERLMDAEERLATAEVAFTLSFLALQRVQGTFTSVQRLEVQRIDEAARGPVYVMRREPSAAAATAPEATPVSDRPAPRRRASPASPPAERQPPAAGPSP